MFTGLVQEIGRVASASRDDKGATLNIECTLAPYTLGESIAVHGVCLTVASISEQGFRAQVSEETLRCSALGELYKGARVHLERALALGEHLGGHLVTGHVDGLGEMVSRRAEGDYTEMTIEVPPRLQPFCAPKGSVTINGVSLTINKVGDQGFDVMLVPHTLEHTTFGDLGSGGKVHLEMDILAKYVASLLGKAGVDGSLPGDSFAS